MPRKSLAPGALEVLARYDWPGNVRELRNALERAALMCAEREIGAEALASIVEGGMFTPAKPNFGAAPADSVGGDADLRLRERSSALEKQLILEALRRAGGKKREASQMLGIDASNFAYYVKKHQIGGDP